MKRSGLLNVEGLLGTIVGVRYRVLGWRKKLIRIFNCTLIYSVRGKIRNTRTKCNSINNELIIR